MEKETLFPLEEQRDIPKIDVADAVGKRASDVDSGPIWVGVEPDRRFMVLDWVCRCLIVIDTALAIWLLTLM